jgi:putative transposase
VHKTANVLNNLPKSQQPRAKRALQEIWMAASRNEAIAAFDAFETWGVKYEKAVECPMLLSSGSLKLFETFS